MPRLRACGGIVGVARVLVTGAGGYIGTALSAALIRGRHDVTAVDLMVFGEEALAPLLASRRLTIVRNDIRNLTPRAFQDIDVVFDLAALSNDPTGDLDPTLTESINCSGRIHVARCAKAAGVKRYVLASSCSVYGRGNGHILDEASMPDPLTTYARANLQAEVETLALGDDDLACSVLRIATVFGLSRRMRFDLVVNRMTLDAFKHRKVYVSGGGDQWRPLVHVRDVARAFVALLNARRDKVAGEIFNVGDANYQMLSIGGMVLDTLPFPAGLEVAPEEADKRNYKVSFDKMNRTLGFRAEVTLREGIREVHEALKAGFVLVTPQTDTVTWYRAILEADSAGRLAFNLQSLPARLGQ